jgi:hypothetical protein
VFITGVVEDKEAAEAGKPRALEHAREIAGGDGGLLPEFSSDVIAKADGGPLAAF